MGINKTITNFLVLLLYSISAFSAPNSSDCQKVLNWIYKDLTLQNLDKSVDRLNKKIRLSFLFALDKSNKNINLKNDPKLLSLYKSMAKIDPDFESYLKEHEPYKKYESWSWWWWNSVQTDEISYKDIAKKWKVLQSERKDLFAGMPEHFKIDQWDLATGDILDKVQTTNLVDSKTRKNFQELAKNFKSNYQELIKPKFFNIKSQIFLTEKSISKVNQDMKKIIEKVYNDNINKFQNICSIAEMTSLLNNEEASCSINDIPNNNLDKEMQFLLKDLSDVVDSSFINKIKEPNSVTTPESSNDYVNVEVKKINYKNINYNGSYCLRDNSIVDTAVIHHTASSNAITSQGLNDMQVVTHENDRNSSGAPDPWYMLAYNYTVSANYSSNKVSIQQGRPDNMKGAHAGAYINVNQLDTKVQKILKNYNFKCGKNTNKDPNHIIDQRDYSTEAAFTNDLKNGRISANMTTTGISMIGNYLPDLIPNPGGGYTTNPGGFPSDGPIRYPTNESLKKIGQLICKLKMETHPNLRKITDHNFIKIKKAMADNKTAYGTCCPGTVLKRMNLIKEYAMEACNFSNNEFVLDISPEVKLCKYLKDL